MFAINTGKNVNLPPSRYDVESKYKSILDLSSKLEAQNNQAKSLQQLYSSSTLNLRSRLCDEIKVIFRYAPIEYGQICEEILWKRNYYDYVKFFKKYRRHINSNELTVFRMHLITGIGHYHSLFFSFRKTFNLSNFDDFLSYLPNKPNSILKISNINYNLTGSNDSKCNTFRGIDDESTMDENFFIGDLTEDDDDVRNELDLDYIHDEKFMETLSFLVHRFCICIGDLARYLVEFFPKENNITSVDNRFTHHYFKIASFYYKTASIIQPSLGMPFNQLGTLYTGSYWGLDSLYFYVRCLNSKKTFSGVKENMRQTFETARKTLSVAYMNGNNAPQIISKMNKPTDTSANHPVKEAVLRLILFFSEIFNLKNSFTDKNISVGNIISISNATLMKISLALNVEPSRVFLRTSPNSLSTESIFQALSMFAILIEQVKTTLKENSIDVKFEDVKFIKSEDVLTDNHLKGNFILFISYRFLFQFATLIMQRESELLRKWLSCIVQLNFNEKSKNPNLINTTINYELNRKEKLTKSKKPMFASSFSSDFNDVGEDSAMLNQLKSTALQSIVSLFDQSDNEEAEEMNGNGNDDSDNESVSDLIDKLIFSDDENDLMDGSLIDEAIGRTDATQNNQPQLNNHAANNSESSKKESITMDQLLACIYTQSHTPVIKFFCDFLQSNGDFLDLFEQLDVLSQFFESFFDYLNRLSEFDFKLVTNFRHYISHCLTGKIENDHKKNQSLLELNALINKFSSEPITEFDQKYPLSSEIDYLHITEELSSYFDQLFDLSSDPCKNYHQINLQVNYSCEQYGYICMRSILVFGIKLALLSLNSDSFKLSIEHNSNLVHNFSQKKAVKFVFTRIRPDSTPLSPFGLSSTPLPISTGPNEPLISFNDPSESSSSNETNFTNNKKKNGKKIAIAANTNDYKSLYALSKLSFVMIDPYVYLEDLRFVRELILHKKAFLVVPKLATDFLNNLKEKNENAKEASDFLSNEFFRGSRMIRFIRNDDRLELEMLKYPRYQWRRDVDTTEVNENEKLMNNISKVKVQDLALFYELLEHCHYLLVNKILADKYQETMSINGNCDLQNTRITLITNNLSKWPPAATSIAETYGIDIETMQSFVEKQNSRFGKPNKQVKPKKYFKPPQQQSPMFFKPIQNTRAEIFVSHPLT